MSRRYPKMYQRSDGWCDWIAPEMREYRMACCDCGLVHTLQFKIKRQTGRANKQGYWPAAKPAERGLRVVFRAQRNNRATAQIRRRKVKK